MFVQCNEITSNGLNWEMLILLCIVTHRMSILKLCLMRCLTTLRGYLLQILTPCFLFLILKKKLRRWAFSFTYSMPWTFNSIYTNIFFTIVSMDFSLVARAWDFGWFLWQSPLCGKKKKIPSGNGCWSMLIVENGSTNP